MERKSHYLIMSYPFTIYDYLPFTIIHFLPFTIYTHMFSRFRQRSYEVEHLDKGDYSAEEYEGCILELQRVNEWLGDASALRSSLLADIERRGLRSFSLLDVGAGSGELLRVTADWARNRGYEARLIGLELNAR